MRILYAGQSLRQPVGGGELSARSLVYALARRHEVRVIGAGSETIRGELAPDIELFDYPIPRSALPLPLDMMRRERQFSVHLRRHVRHFSPDLLILQQPARLEPDSIGAATRLVLFIRSLVCFGIGDPSPRAFGRLARVPLRRLRFHSNRALLQRADLVVTNSRYIQNEVRRRVGIASEVIHPFIDTRRLKDAGRNEACPTVLTFVGVERWKGAALMLGIARRLHERRFLFLEGGRPSPSLVRAARKLPNVTVLRWCDDMAPVFAQTRLLLVPSQWEEPFGRLPVEAGAFGVPTVASHCGGLPESVGKGGVLVRDTRSVDAWVAAIRRLDDHTRYSELSAAAKANAASLDVSASMLRLRKLFGQRLGLEI